MIPVSDFYRRSKEGPNVDSQTFDDLVMDTMMDIVDEHGLELDVDAPIADDDAADAVFAAALDFLERVGVYNATTRHVIRLTRDEISDIVEDYRTRPASFPSGRTNSSAPFRPAK